MELTEDAELKASVAEARLIAACCFQESCLVVHHDLADEMPETQPLTGMIYILVPQNHKDPPLSPRTCSRQAQTTARALFIKMTDTVSHQELAESAAAVSVVLWLVLPPRTWKTPKFVSSPLLSDANYWLIRLMIFASTINHSAAEKTSPLR